MTDTAGDAGTKQDGSSGSGKGRVAVLALSVALLAVGGLLLVAGPLLLKAGLVSRDFARFELSGIATYVLGASVVVALAGLGMALLGRKHRAGIVAVLVMVAGGVGVGTLYAENVIKHDMPPINDVQTDWSHPLAFTEKALKAREDTGSIRVRDDAVIPEGQGKWSGMTYAAAQAQIYDDLEPLLVKQGVGEATAAAARAAKRLGWDVTTESRPDGVMEAVYHEPWYGLVYDVAARVVPNGAGSRIDLRVTSRTADRDMGESASQLRQLRNEISLELR
jgi:hypothetical protein